MVDINNQAKKIFHIGLVDADLLCNGTRHPNLALLKLAGYFRDNGFVRQENVLQSHSQSTYKLLTNESTLEDLLALDYIYVSCVFSFTLDNPPILLNTILCNKQLKKKLRMGGTGSYANLSVEEGFAAKREEDMLRLEKDSFLNSLKDNRGRHGIDMSAQMPDYHLYDSYIKLMEKLKKAPTYYKDYKEYSIGFLTRGCFRRCPFCVNKLERKTLPYSRLNDFLDNEIDENTGKLKRPYIYLWDDNFLASPYWEELLDELIACGRPFQFRQGLDERLLAQTKRGEDMAKKLASANYHGDFIFAFDNWHDRKVIEKALKIWKHHCPKKETKFYLFCGFRQSRTDEKNFQQDIAEIFMRICVLMRHGCLGYIMRHEDYKQAPLPNIYVQIARWCNQPGFYRNLSFWQFCYKNQTYWEEKYRGAENLPLKTYEEFEQDVENGYYKEVGMTTPLKTVYEFLNKYSKHRQMFLDLFNMSFKQMIDPSLWYRPISIMLKGMEYIMDDDFWSCVLGDSIKEYVLMKAFYTHADDSLLSDVTKASILLQVLSKHSCKEIIKLIREEDKLFVIEMKDIPQFSDFKDAYFSVPKKLVNCGDQNIDYERMGYMLSGTLKNGVANKKYGENHIKTAALMGLCSFSKCRTNKNALGELFIKLPDDARDNILPKLCLYIPFIHNYFKLGASDEVRESMLSILSITTQNRRRSNINTIIEEVKKALR
ncbi:MAG: hypothetical protein K2K98_08215 [Muribaculaceae bacterium]|nr:hypothetical protein [Muribaculaceae bacterium]